MTMLKLAYILYHSLSSYETKRHTDDPYINGVLDGEHDMLIDILETIGVFYDFKRLEKMEGIDDED